MRWTKGVFASRKTVRAGLRLAFLLVFCCILSPNFSSPARAQVVATSEKLEINAQTATNWSQGDQITLQLQGPVTIDLDGVQLSANDAVIWLSPEPGALLHEQRAEIALLGDASLQQVDNHVTRSGPQLLVSVIIRGNIRVTAQDRVSRDLSDSPLYKQAADLRQNAATQAAGGPAAPAPPIETTTPPGPPPPAGTNVAPIRQPGNDKKGPVSFHAPLTEETQTDDGNLAIVLGGGVSVSQNRDNGDFLELLADKVVLFTDLPFTQVKSNPDLGAIASHIKAAYLEGDVRINFVSATAQKPEQRITADETYYDFPTDRAVMTDVVIHTIDPLSQIPVIIRAQKMHQLSEGEFTGTKVDLSTSQFAAPTYAIRTQSAYIHQHPNDFGGTDSDFVGTDDTMRVFGTPIFYFPYVSGTVNQNNFVLRNLAAGSSNRYGTGFNSQWGVFEALGRPRPDGLDLAADIDYYSQRGPGFGLEGNYTGGLLEETTNQPWDFLGDFKANFQADKGKDILGGDRSDVTPPAEDRGRLIWEHEHFFPDDWQVQIRIGYVSDPTYLEEYYPDEFYDSLPDNASFYVKRQKDTEALTFLAETDTTRFTTNADRQQEQTDIQRLPELTYRRIGDSLDDDTFTFFSDNSASRLRFLPSKYSLAQQGFTNGLSPGISSDGFTGINTGPVYRGDSRQELDWPVSVGEIKVVPYVMGEVTEYSNSPGGESQSRFYGGVGVRLTTAFWKVDDTFESDFFDLHRVRHVIEPEINLFTSGTTLDNSHLYIFDPNIDAINDISAAQIALHQQWETMRGGPGRWRNVDFLDLNIAGNFYANQPPASILNPVQFRGLFFPSEPQISIPRQGVNADATWRISDTTALLSDAEWNLDQRELATASFGLAVARDERLTYYAEDRYIQVLQSQVLSFSADYRLSAKYSLEGSQSFDLGSSHDVSTSISFVRRFDNITMIVSVTHDAITGINGLNFNLIPLGVKATGGTNSLVNNSR